MEPAPATPAPPTPPRSRRSAQLALAAFLAVMVGLLVFRGYGNRLGARPSDPVPSARVDLNRADRTELEQVPGIGPKHARAIEDHRKENGPFKSVDELRGVHGFGPATVEKVRPFLRVESDAPPPDLELLTLERKPPTPAPAPRAAGAPRKIQSGDPPLNVNAASVEELQRLPGVGPAIAQRLVDARTAAPFKSVEDLRRVKGIGPKTLDGMRQYVVVK
jgi:competence protein ComEA